MGFDYFSSEAIYAGIVLYNPDIERLKMNIDSVINDVDKLIIVNNNSMNSFSIIKLIESYSKVEYIANYSNLGIAKALNQIMDVGLRDNISWVLLLDQDSVLVDNTVIRYRDYLTMPNVGIITSITKDRNSTRLSESIIDSDVSFYDVDKCITSGSLTNVAAWKRIGGFNENLFIDYVDFDFCIRLIKEKYRIIKLNEYGLLHELGNAKEIQFLGKKFVTMNHSSFRKYYTVRNRIFYIVKYSKDISLYDEIIKLIKYVLLTLLFENNRFSNLFAMIKGVIDSAFLIKNEVA